MTAEETLADLHGTVVTDHSREYATSPFFDNGGSIEANVTELTFSVTASFSLETSVRMTRGVFRPENNLLSDLYKPLGRCVAVVDETVHLLHGASIERYFESHGVELKMLVCRALEKDKTLETVGKIVRFLGTENCDVTRREPVLVVGGGVITDTAGLACALLHRRTPYVMVGTSIVSAIDAGPSPRTCVNSDTFKNFLGAYHPPVLTVIDRSLFATLDKKYLRHGMAEMVKMAVVDDQVLFGLLEQDGRNLVASNFADPESGEHNDSGDQILFRSLYSYMKHEGTNMFEAYQDRPHAFGHTWSPTFEPLAGLLHGHAVAIEMCFSTSMALQLGWITEEDRARVVLLCDRLGLAVQNPVTRDVDLLVKAQESMRSKRGGRGLWAPLPKGAIGSCDYLSEASRSLLEATMSEHSTFCSQLEGGGRGTQIYLTS
ncbi:sedoheptulose 7-phosphate cyclase [Streptomyces sp. NPDC020794]|uniref:sedoheptulose 7-phosphate cyclase n=1 Tax=unclassified Streptomyces TaxID=2593676 RepID=UPI0036EF7F4A